MTPEPLLSVANLRKLFPVRGGVFRREIGRVHAVDGVDFFIASGEVLGIVGESGCGKSTIARLVMRLIEPTGGQIFFEGADWLAKQKDELTVLRQKMQIIFQDPAASLNPRKRIQEALIEPLLFHHLVKDEEEGYLLACQVLEKVGLSPEVITRYPHQFSGGQQQRICIGRTLLLKPKLLVCDEVVSALDPSIQAQVLNLLRKLQREDYLSYLFISHDLSIVRYISDKVLVLYLGKVMESASTEELFTNPKHPYTQALLSAVPKSHPAEKKHKLILKGEIPSPQFPPSGCPFRTRCPYAQPICAEIPPRQVVKDAKTGKSDHIYHCILD